MAAGVWRLAPVRNVRHLPDQARNVKARNVKVHSAPLPPDLLHQIRLPGLLMEDIQEQMTVVTTEHQVRSKGMLLPDKGHQTDQEPGLQQDQILLMKEQELRILKGIVETELIVVIEI